jgi:hypothetical protein
MTTASGSAFNAPRIGETTAALSAATFFNADMQIPSGCCARRGRLMSWGKADNAQGRVENPAGLVDDAG